MASNNKGWVDPNYEGKLLRKFIKKLDKLMNKPLIITIDTDDKAPTENEQIERFVGNHVDRVIKIIHCASQAAQAKNSLAKTGPMQKDIDKIKDHLGIK